jgi:phosphoserine phosphatase
LKKNPNVTKDDFETLKLKIEPNPNYQELTNFLRSVDGLKLAISGGIDVLVARIKDFYPIDQIYSNKLVFENNRLVGGKAEVEPQRKGIILSKFKGKKISVGDSRLDEDMFKASDYSILFNSEDDVKVDYVVKGNDLKELTRLLRDLYYG